MMNETSNIKQLINRVTGKVDNVGKRGYASAVSSIEASKRAGKATVLKMEIASRKLRMKKLFTALGERVYSAAPEEIASVLNNVSVKEVMDIIKAQDNEVKEIEDYVASLKNGSNGDSNKFSNVTEVDDVRISDHAFAGINETKNTVLAETEKPADIADMAEGINNNNKEARVKALKQLFKFEGSEAIPLLIKALKDKDAEVRRRAASYLGWKMAVSAAPALIAAVKDKDTSVRKAALEALGELSTKEAVPILIEAMDDRTLEIRKTAYKSLTKTTGEFIEFDPRGSLSDRFKSIQKWEKWWKK